MSLKHFEVVTVASLVLAIAFSAPVKAQGGLNPELATDLVLQIQQLQNEVRMLRGQIEDQAHQIETLQRRQRDQYLDLDQRIGELRGDGTAQPPLSSNPGLSYPGRTASTGPVTSEPLTTTAANTDPGPEVRAPINSQSSISGLAQPQAEARTTQQASEAEKQAYDEAFQDLKQLHYAAAAEGFQDFLNSYPDSDYADNAQYWLGESYYVTRNYDIALQAFQGLISNFPESPKLPDALLKIGYTHYELKQWDQARAALTQVEEQFPDTTLARLASSRLRSMRLEGHY
jgi:tol-pal system protein YbgF